MAFNNWDIPSNLFNILPISRTSTANFIGRHRLVEKYEKLLTTRNIRVVFEGEIGTGKTSLGNYIRFCQKYSFTTDSEIMTQAHWTSREFLLALQSSVLATVKNSSFYKDLFKIGVFQSLLDRNRNIRISSPQMGFEFSGYGVSLGKETTISQPINLDDQTLLNELHEILDHIREKISKGRNIPHEQIRIIFQLNNLDPGELPFTEDKIISFLNSIRDLVTEKIDASFIFNGATGLKALIQKSVKRLSPALSFESIKPLSREELIMALNKRASSEGRSGDIPFEDDLITELYNATSGNFRKTLGMMDELAVHYDSEEPLMFKIGLEDAYQYYFLAHSETLNEIIFYNKKISNKGVILRTLSKLPNASVGEIAVSSSIQQGNVSKLLTELERDGFVIKNKHSLNVNSILAPEYYFASKILFRNFKDE